MCLHFTGSDCFTFQWASTQWNFLTVFGSNIKAVMQLLCWRAKKAKIRADSFEIFQIIRFRKCSWDEFGGGRFAMVAKFSVLHGGQSVS